MADLTLGQRFGTSVAFNETTKVLSINLNDLNSILVSGVDVGLNVSAMTDANKDQFASRILWALLQLQRKNQQTDNNDQTVGVYVTNQGKRNLTRNNISQVGFQLTATVYYREYNAPKIRWRYGSEPWQEIEADDYTIQQSWYGGQNPNIYYRLKYGQASISNGNFAGWVTAYQNQPATIVLPIKSVRLMTAGVVVEEYAHWAYLYANSGNPPATDFREQFRTYVVDVFDATNNWKNWLLIRNSGTKVYGFEPADGSIENNPGGGSCTFTITKNGQTVYTQTRATCPQVEKIPCQLSTVNKQIEIKKLPFLEKIEVVPYQYSAYKSPGVPAPIVQADPIPSQCLNIYKNAIYVIPPLSNVGLYPNATPFDSLITQICSAPGCPPPEYQVICDCNNCQSCPNGTCAVECDGQICCYNDYGVSVAQISLVDYCGGNS
ncbi:MAG: hypothetical protein RLZZ574_2655 [Cyanobacteriota bacterium]|jgi:hypothetical protein